MTGEFQKSLLETENRWLKELYNHVKATFVSDPLPSHNEEHHLRVWNYCKDFLTELDARGIAIDKTFLEQMILAVFFHDTGMSVNRDSNHGKESRRLCEEWMDSHSLPRDEKILQAIEHHDDKTYTLPGGLTLVNNLSILSILNICDDLDAFSYCGIYRYSEIYLLRGISFGELGQQVISNASRRFGNFMSSCMQLPGMIKTHAPRYDVLENFFRQYNAQLRKDPTGRTIDHGPVNIVKIFYRQILGGVNSVESLCSSAMSEHQGIYEKAFFENLRKEWCTPT